MSVDSYFCFCCLATTNLTNLFNDELDCENDYASLLKSLCSVSMCKSHYKDDSYICEECAQKITEAQQFKLQVLNTVNILKINGLVKTKKTTGETTLVTKSIKEYESSDEDVKQNVEHGTENCIDQQNYTDVEYKEEYLDDSNDDSNKEYIKKRPIRKSSSKAKKKVTTKTNSKHLSRYKRYKEVPPYKLNEDLKCDICGYSLPNLPTYHKHMNEHYASFFCEVCSKGFWSRVRLRKHMIIHRTEEYVCPNCKKVFRKYHTFTGHKKLCVKKDKYRYCCNYCDEKFLSFHRRMIHLELVHGKAERQFRCVMCPMSFLVKSDLSVHIKRTHLKLKTMFCDICNMGFYGKNNLIAHMLRHTGQKDFKCSLCPKSYVQHKALVVHMRTHTNDRRFCCPLCGKLFFQKCTLQTHMKVHEKSEPKSQEEAEEEEEARETSSILIVLDSSGVDGAIISVVKTKKTTGETTLVTKSIKEYESSDEDTKQNVGHGTENCIDQQNYTDVEYKEEYLDDSNDDSNKEYIKKRPIRKSSSKAKKKVTTKTNSKHLSRYKRYKEVRPYKLNEDLKCDICGYSLPNLPTYHKHMNEHYASFFCEVCSKGFWSRVRLRKHMIIHRTEEYVCPNCKKVFRKYHTFTGHKKLCVKKDKYRYCCNYCDEKFLSFHRRMIHLELVHGKAERQFRCVMCPMSFLIKSDLSVHIKRTHLKLKTMFCDICNMGFYGKNNLIAHMLRHTGQKDFKCSLCPKSYVQHKALVVHMRTHTNDRRFCCPLCGKLFFQKCTLQTHMKVHEKSEPKSQEEAEEEEEARETSSILIVLDSSGVDGTIISGF